MDNEESSQGERSRHAIFNELIRRRLNRHRRLLLANSELERQRNRFTTRVYSLAALWICLTIIQWLSIILNPNFVEFFKTHYFITYPAAFGALILMAMFVELRFTPTWNWIVAFSIVELVTFGLVRPVVYSDIEQLGMCIGLAILAQILFTFIGFTLPRDITMDILAVTISSVVFFVVMSMFLVLFIAVDLYIPSVLLTVMILILLALYAMYNGQIMSGNRSSSLRWNDYVSASLMTYVNYIVMVTSALFVVITSSYNKLEDSE